MSPSGGDRDLVIRNARRALGDVPEPTSYVSVELDGRGPDTLEGIERFTLAEVVTLNDVLGDELGRLAALPHLRWLSISKLRPETSTIDGLLECAALERLTLYTRGVAEARVVAATDFSALTNLTYLKISASTAVPVCIDCRWLADLPSLADVSLRDLVVDDRDSVAAMRAAPALTHVSFCTLGSALADDVAALEAADHLTDVYVTEWLPMPARSKPEVVRVGDEYMLRFSLVEVWGAETNYDGCDELERLATDAGLRERLTFDPEADGVSVWADDPDPLREVQRLVKERARRA